MPEFWTWWIESGPATCTESSSGSVRVTTCFVTWSATTAASATAARPAHCHGPAASDRSATETGASPFVEDPTRTSFNRPGAGRRCRGAPTGSRASRSSPIGLPQTSQDAVRAVVDPPQRGVDLDSVCCAPSSSPSSSSRSNVAVAVSPRWLSVPPLPTSPSSSSMVPGFSSWRNSTAFERRACSSSRSVRNSLVSMAVTQDPLRRCSRARAAARSRRGRCRQARRSCPARRARKRSRRRAAPGRACRRAARPQRRSRWPFSGAAATRTFQAPPCRPTTPARAAPGETRSLRRVELTGRRLPPGEVPPRRRLVRARVQRATVRAPPRRPAPDPAREIAWNSRVSSRFGHVSAMRGSAAARRRAPAPPRPCRARRAAASRRAATPRRAAPARSAPSRMIERASWCASATITSASRFADPSPRWRRARPR